MSAAIFRTAGSGVRPTSCSTWQIWFNHVYTLIPYGRLEAPEPPSSLSQRPLNTAPPALHGFMPVAQPNHPLGQLPLRIKPG